MTQTVYGSVTFHRLRSNKTVQLYLSSDKGLFQIVQGTSCIPNWNESAGGSGPTITPTLTGATATNHRWLLDGAAMPSNIATVNATNGALHFIKSPVNVNDPRNITLTYRCDISKGGGTTETIERSIQVLVQQGAGNSYWGQIDAPQGVVIGLVLKPDGSYERIESTTLKPTLWLGSEEVKSGFKVKWYRTGTGVGGEDQLITGTSIEGLSVLGNELTVSPAGVNGTNHFRAEYYLDVDSTRCVEAEGISVSDLTDEYTIVTPPDPWEEDDDAETHYFEVDAQVVRKTTGEALTRGVSWVFRVFDTIRLNVYPTTAYTTDTVNGKGRVRMPVKNLYVPNTDPKTKGYKEHPDWPWLSCKAAEADDEAVQETDRRKSATPCEATVEFIASITGE